MHASGCDLNFGRFISSATTAHGVIKLSPHLPRFLFHVRALCVRVFHDFKCMLPQLVEAPPPSSAWRSAAAFFPAVSNLTVQWFYRLYSKMSHSTLSTHATSRVMWLFMDVMWPVYVKKSVPTAVLCHLIYGLMRMETHFLHWQGRSS